MSKSSGGCRELRAMFGRARYPAAHSWTPHTELGCERLLKWAQLLLQSKGPIYSNAALNVVPCHGPL